MVAGQRTSLPESLLHRPQLRMTPTSEGHSGVTPSGVLRAPLLPCPALVGGRVGGLRAGDSCRGGKPGSDAGSEIGRGRVCGWCGRGPPAPMASLRSDPAVCRPGVEPSSPRGCSPLAGWRCVLPGVADKLYEELLCN